jgi:hypothetical protein
MYFVARQQCKVNPLLHSRGNSEQFCIVDSYISVNNIESFVSFPWQQWLRERGTVLRYKYVVRVANTYLNIS